MRASSAFPVPEGVPLPRLSLPLSILLNCVGGSQLCDACLDLPQEKSCLSSTFLLDLAPSYCSSYHHHYSQSGAIATGFRVLFSTTLGATKGPVFPSCIFHGTKEQTTAMAIELIIFPAQHGGEECRLHTVQPTPRPLFNCALWPGYDLSVPQGFLGWNLMLAVKD